MAACTQRTPASPSIALGLRCSQLHTLFSKYNCSSAAACLMDRGHCLCPCPRLPRAFQPQDSSCKAPERHHALSQLLHASRRRPGPRAALACPSPVIASVLRLPQTCRQDAMRYWPMREAAPGLPRTRGASRKPLPLRREPSSASTTLGADSSSPSRPCGPQSQSMEDTCRNAAIHAHQLAVLIGSPAEAYSLYRRRADVVGDVFVQRTHVGLLKTAIWLGRHMLFRSGRPLAVLPD